MASIHELYQRAGLPGAPKIAQRTKERDDLPDVVSHDTVTKLLKGQWVPASWLKVHSIVAVLAEYASHAPDEREEIEKHHRLWMIERGLHEAPRIEHADAQGELASIMVLDAVRGQDDFHLHAVHLRRRFDSVLSSVLPAGAHIELLGDGVRICAPGLVLAIAAVLDLLPQMAGLLLLENRDLDPHGLRVRGSLHVGPVVGMDDGGCWGPAMIDTVRMADAPFLRQAHEYVGHPARPDLSVLVSDEVRQAVGPERCPEMFKLKPLPSKGGLLPEAWLYIPQPTFLRQA
ncbi:hypothetical protein ACFXPZ_22355 [Streptomyces sp. NPDC059101]|uniref:hypothetical protein n=1 Tax=Streptomyces sp. NPDC059101 TaxID=3346728 RepID=UPI0036BC1254